jgi:hypothetical protein
MVMVRVRRRRRRSQDSWALVLPSLGWWRRMRTLPVIR